MSEGNPNVVLCERGIRTFETATRNTLDISAVPVIRAKSHLPIIVDPSHATGVRDYVAPLAKCAVSAGADGLKHIHARKKHSRTARNHLLSRSLTHSATSSARLLRSQGRNFKLTGKRGNFS